MPIKCYRAHQGLCGGMLVHKMRPRSSTNLTKAPARRATLLLAILSVLVNWIAPAFAQPAGSGPNVALSLVTLKSSLTPGDQFAVAVIFDHARGWHVHTNSPVVPKGWDFTPIPTKIVPSPVSGLTSGPVQWPRPKEILADLAGTGHPSRYGVFEGKAVAFLPFVVDGNAALGKRTLSVLVNYQACNDKVCDLPQSETMTIELDIVSPGTIIPASADQSLFAGLDLSAFDAIRASFSAGTGTTQATASTPKPVVFPVFGTSFQIDASGPVGLVIMIALAAVGGFVLNLTPCVLPVIPIKIMGLSAAAGNPRRMLMLGLVMCAGTIAFWLAIGVAIAQVASFKAINQLFQTPFFALGIGIFIVIMAVGMLGWFTIGLPQSVYSIDPKRESVGGSFVFGIMTAVLSTPCTAPFMGSAAAWAAFQRPFVTIIVFTAIGVGMAVPYAALSAFPKLVDRIPRTGPASELVKQVMGLFMLAVAAFFIGTGLDPLVRKPIDPPIRWHWWVVASIVAVTMGWLLYRSWSLTRKLSWRLTWLLLAAVSTLAAGSAARSLTDRGPIAWVAYTPERFQQARDAGKVIVLDFTAEWCLNCKVLEGTVLHRPEIVKLLTGPGVVPMRADLTGNNAAGSAKLKELQWVGIPLLAIFGPGSPEGQKFDTYTPTVVREAVSRAREPRLGLIPLP